MGENEKEDTDDAGREGGFKGCGNKCGYSSRNFVLEIVEVSVAGTFGSSETSLLCFVG